MTGFATDVDLLVVGIELICFGVVAFFDVSTVTLCAAGIPIKIAACPVQRVACQDGLLLVKVIPALSACLDRARIPSDGQCLQTPTRQRQQILL